MNALIIVFLHSFSDLLECNDFFLLFMSRCMFVNSFLCCTNLHKQYFGVVVVQSIDVSEESEYDLFTERFGFGSRSTKSRSPDPFRLFKYSPDRKSSSGY
jgi:hypothetical protein